MSTDVHGMIECRPMARLWGEDDEDAVWHAAIDLFLLDIGNAYDALACLFGVRNGFGFHPLAEGRGLPADASDGLSDTFRAWGRPLGRARYDLDRLGRVGGRRLGRDGRVRSAQPKERCRGGQPLGAGLGRDAHACGCARVLVRAARGLVRLSVPRQRACP